MFISWYPTNLPIKIPWVFPVVSNGWVVSSPRSTWMGSVSVDKFGSHVITLASASVPGGRRSQRNTRRFHQPEAKAGWKRSRGQGRLEKVRVGFVTLISWTTFFLRLSWDFFLLEFMWIKIDTKPEFALFVGNLLLGVFLLMPTRVLGLTSNEFKWNIHKAFMHLSYCVVLELSSRINGHQVGGSKKCWHRGRTVPNTSVQHPTWPSDISNRIVFFVCFLADTVSRVSCHSNFWCESPFLIAQHVIIDDHYIYIYI